MSNRSTEVPTEEDWGDLPSGDLDAQAAFKDFFGKTNAEMQEAFANSVIEMADSLRWMPPVPFGYYINGFADFVMAGKFVQFDAPDAASSFLNLVEEKVRQQPDAIAPAMPNLLPVLRHLALHQADFAADPGIYGNFAEKAKAIEAMWAGRTE